MNATSTATSALTCRVISELDSWRSLEPCWDRLLQASPDRTPWQSYDFLTHWWRHLAGTMALRIVVVERDGSPCLILPLQISRWNLLPGLPMRRLEPIAMIVEVNRPRFALGPDDPEAYDRALAEIWNLRREWHLIRIDEKPWEDPEIDRLRGFASGHACIFRQRFSHLVPFLELNGSWNDYLKGRSRRMRSNLRAARRKLEAMGRVELRDYRTEPEIRAGFQLVLDLHERSWKRKRKVEYSRTSAYQDFFRGWLARMAEKDQARILALFCDGRPVAATIALTDATTYYSAQIVHDAAFNHCSPGTLLESMELERLMNEGRYSKYDFLGSFLNNKLRWTDTALSSSQILVMQRSLRSLAMDAYYFRLKPFVRPKVIGLIGRFLRRKPDLHKEPTSDR